MCGFESYASKYPKNTSHMSSQPKRTVVLARQSGKKSVYVITAYMLLLTPKTYKNNEDNSTQIQMD